MPRKYKDELESEESESKSSDSHSSLDDLDDDNDSEKSTTNSEQSDASDTDSDENDLEVAKHTAAMPAARKSKYTYADEDTQEQRPMEPTTSEMHTLISKMHKYFESFLKLDQTKITTDTYKQFIIDMLRIKTDYARLYATFDKIGTDLIANGFVLNSDTPDRTRYITGMNKYLTMLDSWCLNTLNTKSAANIETEYGNRAPPAVKPTTSDTYNNNLSALLNNRQAAISLPPPSVGPPIQAPRIIETAKTADVTKQTMIPNYELHAGIVLNDQARGEQLYLHCSMWVLGMYYNENSDINVSNTNGLINFLVYGQIPSSTIVDSIQKDPEFKAGISVLLTQSVSQFLKYYAWYIISTIKDSKLDEIKTVTNELFSIYTYGKKSKDLRLTNLAYIFELYRKGAKFNMFKHITNTISAKIKTTQTENIIKALYNFVAHGGPPAEGCTIGQLETHYIRTLINMS